MLIITSLLIFSLCVGVSILTKNYKILTIWNFFTCFVLLNIVFRSVYIELGIAKDIIDPWAVFLPGLTSDDLVFAAFFYFFGILALGAGYLLIGKKKKFSFWPIHDLKSIDCKFSKRIINRLNFMLIISVISFIYYVVDTLASSYSMEILAQISGYRGVSDDLESYNARGYLRLLIGLSQIVNLFSYYLLLVKHPKSKTLKCQFFFSFFVILLMSIFTSQRASMVFLFLNLYFLRILVLRKLPRPITLIVGVAALSVMFSALTALRGGSELSSEELKVSAVSISAPIVLNNGGLDLSKTILVKKYVDENLNFKVGSTLALFAVLVIPRAFWPGKPVNLDTFIGMEIYGATSYGTGAVPPGFPAELYLNFHYLGYFLGMFTLGVFAKLLHNDFIQRRHEFYYNVYFVIIALGLLNSVMGSGFSSVVMGLLMELVPMGLLISKNPFRFKRKKI